MIITIDVDGDDVLLTRFLDDEHDPHETMNGGAEAQLTPKIETAINAVIRLIEGESK